ILRRNRVSLCRSWRWLLHRGFSHRPTVGAPGVVDLLDVGCAPHLNPCAVADLFELPHAAAIFDERADACACGGVGDFRRTRCATGLFLNLDFSDSASSASDWWRRLDRSPDDARAV